MAPAPPQHEGSDDARRAVVERGLAPLAFQHLAADALAALPFEALGPVKALLKQFLSTEVWGEAQAEALADSVGPGEGRWSRPLDADVTVDYGWDDGRFFIGLTSTAAPEAAPAASEAADPLAATFDGPVIPEATPNPRTIRFHVGPIHEGPSRWYESEAAASEDAAAHRLFSTFPEVGNVLIGPDFVAVGLHRPSDWERLLAPVLEVVTDEYGLDEPVEESAPRVMGGPAGAGAGVTAAAVSGGERRLNRLELAWRELESLRPADPAAMERLREEATGDDPFHRQVAANLLGEAPHSEALPLWRQLIDDPVRSVRRAAVDAVVDAGREELRPLLEHALNDGDGWVRWKALRGLVEMGPDPSRGRIAVLAADRDFRVRLEAAAAMRAMADESGGIGG